MQAHERGGLVDIMLMSASTAEVLAERGVFRGDDVTPAVRLNDTTDIWTMRNGRYRESASRPFRTASIPLVRPFANLGLYSMTFSNDIERDLANVEAYRLFREEALGAGMRHFLEVFNPAIDIGIAGEDLALFVNDVIVRSLAGLTRPNGRSSSRCPTTARAHGGTRLLRSRQLIVGILGGAKGTTRDTFELSPRRRSMARASRCSAARSISLNPRWSWSRSCAASSRARFRRRRRCACTMTIWRGPGLYRRCASRMTRRSPKPS